jgi:hypothetical protein
LAEVGVPPTAEAARRFHRGFVRGSANKASGGVEFLVSPLALFGNLAESAGLQGINLRDNIVRRREGRKPHCYCMAKLGNTFSMRTI